MQTILAGTHNARRSCCSPTEQEQGMTNVLAWFAFSFVLGKDSRPWNNATHRQGLFTLVNLIELASLTGMPRNLSLR